MNATALRIIFLSSFFFACHSRFSHRTHPTSSGFTEPDWGEKRWKDVPENPLIDPAGYSLPELVIGDPQILTPGDFDEQWHAFYHGFSHDDKGVAYMVFSLHLQ